MTQRIHGMKKKNDFEHIFDEIVKMLKSHKKSVLILGLFVLLSAGMWLRDQAETGDSAGIVERDVKGGSTQNRTFSFRLERESDGDTESISVDSSVSGEWNVSEGQNDGFANAGELELDISAVQPGQEEAFALLEEAVAEWEEVFLGENASVNEVRENLVLPSEICDGLVLISYESSDYGVLQTDGTVETDTLTEEGTLVELTAAFTYGEYTQIETVTLCILPPAEGSAEWLYSELEEAAQQAEENSREESSFSLPESVAGYRVIWEEDQDYQWVYFLLIGVALAICLEQRDKQTEKDRKKKRMEQLEYEYPQMVDQFSVLIDSGMTIRGAWERILKKESYADQRNAGNNRQKNSALQEEMWITYREIREGRGEREAYERFGDRIGLMPYKRFSSILAQNLSKGTRDMKELLQKESLEALDMRKNRARRLGEEAGAKLLFPMLVMLLMILLPLLLPALTSL